MPFFTQPAYPQRRRFLREFNKAHEPAGTADKNQDGKGDGGQFARKEGTGSAEAPPQRFGRREVLNSEEGLKQFKKLKAQWANVNHALLDHVDTPDSPEARALMEHLKSIVKEMYKLDVDPGGIEGIGLPGGVRDLVIVGAGPGGLAAAVMGGTDGLDTLFIDAKPIVGGQAKFSSRIENYPGFPIGTTGENLATKLHEQAQRVGAEGKLGVRVTGITHDPATDIKTLTLSDGTTVESRVVILAGGVEFQRSDLVGEGEEVIYGDGKQLSKESAGHPAIVVGGSNGAAQAALAASRTATHVTVISRSPITKGMSDYQVQALRNNPKITVIEGDEVLSMQKGGEATVAVTKQGRRIPMHRMGMFIGGVSDLKWLPSSIRTNKGKVEVDPSSLETSMPGVYAVGDMRAGGTPRIGVAVGEGQVAVRSAWEFFYRGPK